MTNNVFLRSMIKEINCMAEHYIMPDREIRIMDLCGTHIQNLTKTGLRSLFADNIKLISGPCCPICVTEKAFIDQAVMILDNYNVTLVTFRELMGVKGTTGSLLDEKNKGKEIQIIYSCQDVFQLAEDNPTRQFVFLAVGMDLSASIIASVVESVREKNLKNLWFLTSLKLIQPLILYILKKKKKSIHGFIFPTGMISMNGEDPFSNITKEYHIPAIVSDLDFNCPITIFYSLLKQITGNKEIHSNGKQISDKDREKETVQKIIKEVFEITHGQWRNIGIIPNSELTIKEAYKDLDASKAFPLDVNYVKEEINYQCHDVMIGNKMPKDCNHFGTQCNPLNPLSTIMSCQEGVCSMEYQSMKSYSKD